MTKNGSPQYDIQKSWLVHGAIFDKYDIPFIRTATDTPKSMLPFSKRNKATDFSSWIHFYEQDYKFAQIIRNPANYVSCLQKFGGIISPDFSICPDYPWPLQIGNKYWNHALAYWLSTQGIPVIPNVRWGDKHSFDFCFSGIEKNGVVAVGTHGQLKNNVNKKLFLDGLPIMVAMLSPHTICVYGKAPDDVFGQYRDAGMRIICFPSETEQYFNNKGGGLMGGGHSKKFIGTRGSVGERQHYQNTIFDELPMRNKPNDGGIDIARSVGLGPVAGMKKCFCCQGLTIPAGTENEICPVCGWIDDSFQNTHPNSLNGKNHLTLLEARKQYRDSQN